jgi:SNF2 family DNA or RNA helicase
MTTLLNQNGLWLNQNGLWLNSNSLLWQNKISLWQNKISLWQTKYTEFCKKNNIMIKSHQIEGVIWCLQRELAPSSLREEVEGKEEEVEEEKMRGGVLADEMGMGKTIQMIGVFMLNPQRKTLLIVPPILVNQWHAEIRKFTGHVATIYYGKDRKKIDLLDPRIIVVITSYETVVRDIERFKEITWNRVVCDEAHHLRNPKTLIYTAVRDVLSSTNNCTNLWMITGTPMHHSPKDLYSLYFLFGYSLAELSREKEEKGLAILRSRFLQRKHQVSDLPKKTEHTILIEWTESGERDLAKDIHQTIPFLGFSSLGEYEKSSFWEKKKRPLLVSMIRAKQTCILSKMTEKSYLEDSEETKDEEQTIPFLATFDKSTTTKLQEIIRLLNSRRENGNGKVIFCHYQLEMAYLLEKLSISLDDKTESKSWVGTWRNYNPHTSNLGESPILILQIQSGCEGLNLQAHFSEVYFVSPDWNPTLEEQAIARCWRIGQKKPVDVFRFSMNFVDTPEENFQRRNEVRKYRSLFDPLPFDLQHYISSFLQTSDSSNLENARKYSMDQYTFVHSERKRTKIMDFLSKIA